MNKEIVRDIKILHHKTELVKEGEDISQILTDLRDTFKTLKGYGLAANQIEYNKAVAIVEFKGNETVLVNPKILEKTGKFELKGEACFSFPGIGINTDRWNDIVVENGIGENIQRGTCTGLEAVIWQHEIDHLNGLTIVDRKHKAK